MAGNKIISRSLSANIDADGTSDNLSCEDLGPGKFLMVTEEVNDGNVSIQPEWSADGENWWAFGSAITQAASFPVMQELVDSADNDLPAKYIRFVTSSHTGTGEYGTFVIGRQLNGFA